MNKTSEMGVRRFGRVNWLGLWTLAVRENRRFLNIWLQTVLAPMVTAGLFLAVFALSVGRARPEVLGVPFVQFLAPGLLMMSVIQNAFANSSSSLLASKIQGNIVDTLMPPLSPLELVIGFLAGSVGRAFMVAIAVWVFMAVFAGSGMAHPFWAALFVLLGALMLGALGLIAATVAVKFDHLAAFSNFIIAPLSFLSGTFYSIQSLPAPVRALSAFNPIFYLIDGVRYGMIGRSDSAPWLGATVVLGVSAMLIWLCWYWMRTGYKLKA